MNKLSKVFSNEEFEEIEVFRNGTYAMSVEGKEVICFKLLYQLVNEDVQISAIDKDELLTAYAQLKSFKEISNSIGIFDTMLLETVVKKFKRIITEELETRNK